MIVMTAFCVLVTRTVVTGFHFVSVIVFCGAVIVLIVADTPLDTVTVGVVVTVERAVDVPVMVVGEAVKTVVEL